jgi:hypothetical protein
MVGADGGEQIYRRHLQIKGLGPGFCEGGEASVSFSAGHGGEGGRYVADGATASSSRSAVEVRGL